MKLITGGFAQGKLNYVLRKYDIKDSIVWDGQIMEAAGVQEKTLIINHFHHWVKDCILDGKCPEKEILVFLENQKNCIIISDEIGNGIVPADEFERKYREQVGRLLVKLAARAETVERVICGIGQRIK